MKGLKKLLLAGITAVLAVGLLAGCQNGQNNGSVENKGNEGEKKGGKIVVAASPTPHTEILKQVVDDLKEKGYELEIKEFSDYIQPNLVVDSGEIDANFFQHQPYLDDFNKEKGTKIVSVAKVHYEPLAVYPGKSEDLKQINDGATIAVPNDTTNEARALLLLETNGLIRIKEGAGLTATKKDIVENPHNIDIVELEAAQVSRVADEVDFVVLNGNYALAAGFNVSTDSLAKEEQDSEAAQTYANVLCVKEGNENREDIKALIEALKSDKVKKYIADTYNGAVIAID